MKNTLAVLLLFVGGVMVFSGYEDYSIADTLRFISGQPMKKGKLGSSSGSIGGSTIPGTATADPKDRPGYSEDQLQKNPDGSWMRDSDGYIVLKPGAQPFDPSMTQPKPGETPSS